MKIKRLQIRNIASIEKADIDFENGLIDKVTGKPASIFLISGDTGSGKSIILDAISMALYKTTPRVANVPSKSNNSYKSTNGQDVNIFSIQQYTRIGISPKDDCFCELLFEGNDGKDYTARVTLGLKNCQAKDSDGSEIWAHRSPAWHLQQGGNVWNKDSDIKPEIAKAVGLTFEQFNRMAMLAQGQFEKFLCGEKREREEVLEQLTNTEHFTKFGEAIRSIFSKARTEKENAETRLLTVTNLIGTNNVAEWQQTIDENTQKQISLGKQIDDIDEFLKQMAVISQNRGDRDRAQTELTRLQTITNSSDHQQKLELTQRWNETEEQRQARKSLLETHKRKTELQEQTQLLKEQYANYVADLQWRKEANSRLSEQLGKTAQWIEQQSSRKAVYDNAQTINAQLKQYGDLITEISGLEKKKKDEADKSQSLTEALETAKKNHAAAQDLANKEQKKIEKLMDARKELAVEKLQEDIFKINGEIQAWKELADDCKTMEEQLRELAALKEELKGKNEELGKWEKEIAKREADYDEADRKYKETSNRYSTMSSSVEETLANLRKELKHVDICPLCGQKLDHANFETEYFSELLSPLEKERNEAYQTFQKAYNALVEAKEKAAALKGEVESKEELVGQKGSALAALKGTIMQRAEKGGLNKDAELQPQIIGKQQETEKKLEDLREKQGKAEDMQKQIEQLQNSYRTLSEAAKSAALLESAAKSACDRNAEMLNNLTQNIASQNEKKNDLNQTLSSELSPVYADWETNISETMQTLDNDSSQYQKKVQEHEKSSHQLTQEKSLCTNVESISQGILSQFGDWRCSPQPRQSLSNDVLSCWHQLSQNVSSLATNVNNTRNDIGKHTSFLNEYYQTSGTDEQQLDALIAQAANVEGAKNEINQVKANITAQNQQIENANAHIRTALETLKLKSESELPEKVQLEEAKRELNEQKNACLQAISAADALWKKYKENQNELAAAQVALDKSMKKFNRWNALDSHFGGTRFRTLVQTYILRPLLNNANIYLERITDRYTLTCSEDNEQLSILVLDKYNKNEVRSVTVLSGGERFMISLALSLALSSLNRPDLNINILFIDEGFGTLDEKNLDSVMQTLETLQQIAGQHDRRVGMISHREEIMERIPTQIRVTPKGAGRSVVTVVE